MARSGARRRYIAAWVAGPLLCFALVGVGRCDTGSRAHRHQRAGNCSDPRPCARTELDRRRRVACDPPDIRVRSRLAGLTRDRLERRPVPRGLGRRGIWRARRESRRERRDRRAGGWLRHLPGEREPGLVPPSPGAVDSISSPGWSGNDRVEAVRITEDGEVLDTRPIEIYAGPRNAWYVSIAWNGTNFLVAWSTYENYDGDVVATRVSPSGTVLDPGGIEIAVSSRNDGEHNCCQRRRPVARRLDVGT